MKSRLALAVALGLGLVVSMGFSAHRHAASSLALKHGAEWIPPACPPLCLPHEAPTPHPKKS